MCTFSQNCGSFWNIFIVRFFVLLLAKFGAPWSSEILTTLSTSTESSRIFFQMMRALFNWLRFFVWLVICSVNKQINSPSISCTCWSQLSGVHIRGRIWLVNCPRGKSLNQSERPYYFMPGSVRIFSFQSWRRKKKFLGEEQLHFLEELFR